MLPHRVMLWGRWHSPAPLPGLQPCPGLVLGRPKPQGPSLQTLTWGIPVAPAASVKITDCSSASLKDRDYRPVQGARYDGSTKAELLPSCVTLRQDMPIKYHDKSYPESEETSSFHS